MLEKEVLIHSSLQHPNIVRLEKVLEKEEACYMVMEKAGGGELFEKIGKAKLGGFLCMECDGCQWMSART